MPRSPSKPLPDQSVLQAAYEYDPDTGILNLRGKTCGRKGKGQHTKLNGVQYRVPRVIWKLVYGTEPDHVDHWNGNPLDNRIANLRDATAFQNQQNRQANLNNQLGVKGVCRSRSGKFLVQLMAHGRKMRKEVDTLSEAKALYEAWSRAKHDKFSVFTRNGEIV